MLTYRDIFSKEITAVDPSEFKVCAPVGYADSFYAAWIHPGGLYALLLTEEEVREYNLTISHVNLVPWMEDAWKSARLQENFNSFSVVLGGKKRKLWFNMPREKGDSIPQFYIPDNAWQENKWYYYPLANTLYSRLKVRHCDVYQAIKTYSYFLATNGRPYAMIMPVRLVSSKKDEV